MKIAARACMIAFIGPYFQRNAQRFRNDRLDLVREVVGSNPAAPTGLAGKAHRWERRWALLLEIKCFPAATLRLKNWQLR